MLIEYFVFIIFKTELLVMVYFDCQHCYTKQHPSVAVAGFPETIGSWALWTNKQIHALTGW